MNSNRMLKRPSLPAATMVGHLRTLTGSSVESDMRCCSAASFDLPYISTGAGASSSVTGLAQLVLHKQLLEMKTKDCTPEWIAACANDSVPSTLVLQRLARFLRSWASTAAQ